MSRPTPHFVPLRRGDRVAVVSPSGAIDAEHVNRGIEWLSSRYQVDSDARRLARTGYFAGEDTTRANALIDALENPAVRAIFVTRGGYGAMRVLECAGDRVRAALRRDPKPIVGFSDVTALHGVWAQENVLSIHGPMIAAIGRGDVRDEDRGALLGLLEAGTRDPWRGLTVWREGSASGHAVGGNLALLAALAGTSHAPSLVDAVLFIEDVGERPYRIDRMLTQLRLAGAFRELRGVVLGDFSECEPGPDGTRVEDVLRERFVDLGVPVYANAPFGHALRQSPFAYGAMVHLDEASIRFEAVEVSAKPYAL